MEDDKYDGIPLEELRIDSIDWSHRAEHINTRSRRKGRGEFDVEPAWATEAALDPERIVRTTSGRSIKLIGLSPSAPPRNEFEVGRIIKVWLVPKQLEDGEWWGASACEANEKDRAKYEGGA